MNMHALIAYIRYLWRAKKLHGIHSPFAYTFSEEILYTDNNGISLNIPGLQLPKKYAHLLQHLKEKRHYLQPVAIVSEYDDHISDTDMLVMVEHNPGKWMQLFNKHMPSFRADCVVAIPGIHKTRRHSKKWQRLHTHPRILMSIDLYGIGLVFFKREFKEKQHFILSY